MPTTHVVRVFGVAKVPATPFGPTEFVGIACDPKNSDFYLRGSQNLTHSHGNLAFNPYFAKDMGCWR